MRPVPRAAGGVIGTLLLVIGINAHAHTGAVTRRPQALATSLQPQYVPGEILLAVDDDSTLTRSAAHARLAQSTKRIGDAAVRGHGYRVDFRRVRLKPGVSLAEALATYRRLPGVRAASLNYLKYPAYTPSDPLDAQLWSFNNNAQIVANANYGTNNPGVDDSDIDAPEAWDLVHGDANTVVAIIDAGVDYTHPDLAAAMWDASNAHFNGVSLASPYHGYDFANHDNDPYPINSDHGTHVAGIVAASGDNRLGVTGVAYGAKLMALKVFPDVGGGASNADIIAAINYAVENGAQIINLSVSGGGTEDAVLTQALQHAVDAGVLIVAAAGNDAHDNDAVATWPGNYAAHPATRAGTLSVMASDQADMRANFSNFGLSAVTVAAPGTNVLSTITGRRTMLAENGAQLAAGTAMSCDGNVATCFDGTIFDGGSIDCYGSACRWGWDEFGGHFILNADSASPQRDRYLGGSDGTITSKQVDVGLSRRLVLRYLATWDLRCDVDYVDVQIWTGAVWKTLSAPRFNVDNNREGGCASAHTHTGHMAGIYGAQAIAYDLSAYASNRLKIRFVYVSGADDAPTTVAHGFQLWDLSLDAQTDDYTNAYGVKSGTSMAAPMISGIAALLRAYRPDYTNVDLRRAILNGGDTRTPLASLINTGRRANAYGALFAPLTPIAESDNGMLPAGIGTSSPQLVANDTGGGCSVLRGDTHRGQDPALIVLALFAMWRRISRRRRRAD